MWNPGLPSPDDAILHNWTGKADFNVKNRIIDSTHSYINNMDPQSSIPEIFFYQLCHQPYGNKDHALGGILCLWPDVNVDEKENIYRHNPVYPAIVAGSESYWNGRENYKEEDRISL